MSDEKTNVRPGPADMRRTPQDDVEGQMRRADAKSEGAVQPGPADMRRTPEDDVEGQMR